MGVWEECVDGNGWEFFKRGGRGVLMCGVDGEVGVVWG